MTTNLECRLGVVNLELENLVGATAGLPAFIHNEFQAYSHGDIDLLVTNPVLVPNPSAPQVSVSALQLHNWLLAVNQNNPSAPLRNICLLFAHSYASLPGAFGMMFDRGFATYDDPNDAPIFVARPRQGCAVFLGQIDANRPSQEFASEAFFTAVHELGHLFNLQHDESCLNFMRVSEAHAFGPPAYNFTPDQQLRLEACSSDPNVMPGSSIFEADDASNREALERPAAADTPRLTLAVSRSHYWRFEPIQLEIELSLEGVAEQTLEIPAVVDPSQERFRLMIENDLGERYLYRPPYRVCGGSAVVNVRLGQPYRRDFPLFGQAGGYTFRRSGRHTVWAELNLGNRLIRSNDLEIHILREIGLSPTERELKSKLMHPRIGTLLFHREDHVDQIAVRKLARFIERSEDIPSYGELNYAVARAMLKQALRDNRGPLGSAKKFLTRALSDKSFGAHQRNRATSILNGLENIPRKRRK